MSIDNNDLELALFDEASLIRPGVTHHDRLEYVGLDKIVALIGQGYRLRTGIKAKELGILNVLKVPEHAFYAWLLRQPNDQQDKLNTVLIIQKNRLKEDLIQRGIETLDDFDDLTSDVSESRITPADGAKVASILGQKSKAASNVLAQIATLEKVEHKSRQANTPSNKVTIHVYSDDAQKERVKKLKQLRDKQ